MCIRDSIGTHRTPRRGAGPLRSCILLFAPVWFAWHQFHKSYTLFCVSLFLFRRYFLRGYGACACAARYVQYVPRCSEAARAPRRAPALGRRAARPHRDAPHSAQGRRASAELYLDVYKRQRPARAAARPAADSPRSFRNKTGIPRSPAQQALSLIHI